MTFDPTPGPHPGHGQGPAGASLSDLLTTAKNLVTALTGLGLQQLQLRGQTTVGAQALTAAALVKRGPGRVARVNVIAESGGATGSIIDASSATATGPVIFTIPNPVGSYDVDMPFGLGLVVAPGSGQTVTVSYS